MRENLRDDIAAAIKKMQRGKAPILAIDIPSGIHADTGQILGAAVNATATITFIGLKLGLFTGNGVAYAGEVVLNDLQLPAELFCASGTCCRKNAFEFVSFLFKTTFKRLAQRLVRPCVGCGG